MLLPLRQQRDALPPGQSQWAVHLCALILPAHYLYSMHRQLRLIVAVPRVSTPRSHQIHSMPQIASQLSVPAPHLRGSASFCQQPKDQPQPRR